MKKTRHANTHQDEQVVKRLVIQENNKQVAEELKAHKQQVKRKKESQ